MSRRYDNRPESSHELDRAELVANLDRLLNGLAGLVDPYHLQVMHSIRDSVVTATPDQLAALRDQAAAALDGAA